MNECSKATTRRIHTPGFASHYFVGHGIDVGSGTDGLGRQSPLFPGIRSLREFDQSDGDAQTLSTLANDQFDFLHSSHCLEHLHDPEVALRNWIRVVRSRGYLVVLVPDEDMYEQGIWPSTFNSDHKRTFTVCKADSWSPVSCNLLALLQTVAGVAEILRIESLHTTFVTKPIREDQTLGLVAECAIEFVLRKR